MDNPTQSSVSFYPKEGWMSFNRRVIAANIVIWLLSISLGFLFNNGYVSLILIATVLLYFFWSVNYKCRFYITGIKIDKEHIEIDYFDFRSKQRINCPITQIKVKTGSSGWGKNLTMYISFKSKDLDIKQRGEFGWSGLQMIELIKYSKKHLISGNSNPELLDDNI